MRAVSVAVVTDVTCHCPGTVTASMGGWWYKGLRFLRKDIAVEGNAGVWGAESRGRALIDFLSHTAERGVQGWAPGETCPVYIWIYPWL